VAAPRRIMRALKESPRVGWGRMRRGHRQNLPASWIPFFARGAILPRATQKESPAVKRGQVKLLHSYSEKPPRPGGSRRGSSWPYIINIEERN
jgi:hypothetical protein